MTSLAELTQPDTSDDVLRFLLQMLTLRGFPATSWASGSVAPTILGAEADYFADLGQAIARIAKGGFIDDAEGAWLDLLCLSFYQEARVPAVFTQGTVVLTDTANQGPFTIAPGTVWVTEGTRTLRFVNLTGGVLPLGGALPLTFQAESPGAAFNLANDTITVLITTLPGVSISNVPPIGALTWVTQVGADAESDPAYRGRCKAKWGTLGSGSNAEAFVYNATTPSVTGTTEVTRVQIYGDPTTGAVTLFVAGALGPVSLDALTRVDAVMEKKRPLTVPVLTLNATPSQTAIAGVVYVDAQHDPTAALAAVRLALDALARSVRIAAKVYVSQLIATIKNVPGVYNVTLSAPTADVALGPSTVFTPIYLLTAQH
jgi:uncharacterized phage protein gp47/JayE